jgi:hypothetical protein
LLLIFPILFIPLLFPTGRPPSPRWRWLIVVGLAMCTFLFFGATFAADLGPISGEFAEAWTVSNPIGFLRLDAFPLVPWLILLGIITIMGSMSLFVRYRSAAAVERQQIKWLLFACSLFAIIYVSPSFSRAENSYFSDVMNALLFLVAMPMIPAAIAIAILRYRLWDIDILIRRTLVYGLLTGTLLVVYLSGIVLTQAILGLFAPSSSLSLVLSTLGTIALFNPLRRRIQSGIDRRFYRSRYDVEQIFEAFTKRLRDQVDPDQITAQLLGVLEGTLQPDHASLWLKPDLGKWKVTEKLG